MQYRWYECTEKWKSSVGNYEYWPFKVRLNVAIYIVKSLSILRLDESQTLLDIHVLLWRTEVKQTNIETNIKSEYTQWI